MALVEMKSKPTEQELKWFGVIMLVFFAAIGTVIYVKAGAPITAFAVAGAGVGLAMLYYAVRPLRVPLYAGWMGLFFPIGWTISHLMLVVIYYVVVTPIGLVLRLVGREPVKRRHDPTKSTYWLEQRAGGEPSRYLRQY